MSKRFGRNQKRRLRAEVAALKNERDHAIRSISAAKHIYDNCVSIVEEVLGPRSVYSPKLAYEHIPEGHDRMPTYTPMPSWRGLQYDPMENVQAAMVNLERFECVVRRDAVQMRQHISFINRTGRGVEFIMSEELLNVKGFDIRREMEHIVLGEMLRCLRKSMVGSRA